MIILCQEDIAALSGVSKDNNIFITLSDKRDGL